MAVSQAVLELLVSMKDEASAGLSSLGGTLSSLGGIAGGVALAGVAAFGAAVVDGLGDAKETAQLMAQTEAVIKSTGGAAGVSADQVADLASSLSDAAGASTFGDDQIQAGENLLLTFTNIKETLPDATKIMVDMAQAMGTDVKGGAIQLGKALNDPIAGISALSRVGVTFDDKQKKLIETMVKSGDVAGAQRVILAELNKEFGGSAQAAADATGGWSELTGRLGEAKETLGTAVLPLLNILAGVLLDKVVPVVEQGAAAFASLVAAFQTGASDGAGFIGGLTNALYSLDTISPIFDTIGDGIVTLADAFSGASGATGSFVTDIGYAIDTLLGFTDEAAGPVQSVLQSLVATFTDAQTPVQGAIAVLAQVSPVFNLIVTTVQAALPILQEIVQQVFGFIQTFIAQNGADIQATVGEAWTMIQTIIQTATTLISGIVLGLTIVVRDFLAAHGTEITNILTDTWTIIKNVILGALEIIQGVLKAALQIFQGDWQGAWETIQQMSVSVTQRIGDIIKAGLDIIANFMGTSLSEIAAQWSGAWDGIVAFVKSIDWAAVGAGVISGIISGISGGVSALTSAVKNAAQSALDAAKNALGIHSPSRVFSDEVGVPMIEGISQGILGEASSLAASLTGVLDSALVEAQAKVAQLQSLANFSPGSSGRAAVGALVAGGTFSNGGFSGSASAAAGPTIHVDARGSNLTTSQIRTAVRQGLDAAGTSALTRVKTGA